MFEKYTQPARDIIFESRAIAIQFRSTYIQSEHFLYALTNKAPELIVSATRSPDAVKQIQAEIEAGAGDLKAKEPLGDTISFANPVKRILAYTAEEADRLGHKVIAPGHFMLGILREENSLAEKIVTEHGAKLRNVRQQIKTEWESDGNKKSLSEFLLMPDREVAFILKASTAEAVENGTLITLALLKKHIAEHDARHEPTRPTDTPDSTLTTAPTPNS